MNNSISLHLTEFPNKAILTSSDQFSLVVFRGGQVFLTD